MNLSIFPFFSLSCPTYFDSYSQLTDIISRIAEKTLHCNIVSVQITFCYVFCVLYYYGNPRVGWICVHVTIKFILNHCGFHHHQQQHHLANMELGDLLTCSGVVSLEVSWIVFPGFFCQLVCSFLILLVIYYRVFCLYVATSFFRILIFFQKLGLYLVLLQCLCLVYNLSKCILLVFSYISSLLL